jgi:hypothetical protein
MTSSRPIHPICGTRHDIYAKLRAHLDAEGYDDVQTTVLGGADRAPLRAAHDQDLESVRGQVRRLKQSPRCQQVKGIVS